MARKRHLADVPPLLVVGLVLMILAFQTGILNFWFGILGLILVVLPVLSYLFGSDRRE